MRDRQTELRLKLFIVDLDVTETCKGCFFNREQHACAIADFSDLECELEVNGVDRDFQWIEVDEKGKPL